MEKLLRVIRRSLRDCFRGFTDEDVRTLQYRLRLLELQPPGEMIWLTRGETMALSRGRVIGVWTISVLSVKLGRARVAVRQHRALGLDPEQSTVR